MIIKNKTTTKYLSRSQDSLKISPSSKGKLLKVKVTAKELKNFPPIGDVIMPKANIFYDYICNKNKRPNKIPEMKPIIANKPKVNLFNQISKMKTKIEDSHEIVSSYSTIIQVARRSIDKSLQVDDKAMRYQPKHESQRLNPPKIMEDIQNEYHRRKMKVPRVSSIDKDNLFEQNPLLQIGSDIKKFYLFYRNKVVEKNVNKYLMKVSDIYNEKVIPNFNERELQRVLNRKKEIDKKEQEIINQSSIDIKSENVSMQKDAIIIKETIKDMELMDEFFMTRKKKFHGFSSIMHNQSRNVSHLDKIEDQSENYKENVTTAASKKISFSKLREKSTEANSASSRKILFEKKSLSIDNLYHECSTTSFYKNNLSGLINEYAKRNNINVSNEALIDNMKKLGKTVLVRNFASKEYDLQKDTNRLPKFTPEQKRILLQNEIIKQSIRKSEEQTLRMLLNHNDDDE